MDGYSADGRMTFGALLRMARLVELVESQAAVERERRFTPRGGPTEWVTDYIRFSGFEAMGVEKSAESYTPVEDLMVVGYDENGAPVSYPATDMAEWIYDDTFKVQYV